MGFVRKRIGTTGATTCAAMYRDARGKVRHAGTFPTRRQAEQAWQHREALMAAGRPGDPTSGRVTFADYVNETWFPALSAAPTRSPTSAPNCGRC